MSKPERCRWDWGARPPRAQPTAPSRLAGDVRTTAPFGLPARTRVRREGAPNGTRGGCAPHSCNRIVPGQSRSVRPAWLLLENIPRERMQKSEVRLEALTYLVSTFTSFFACVTQGCS